MMDDSSKNKQALTGELESLKRRIRELEQAEARWKQVEEALNKSDETFRNLIENAPDAIYVHTNARFLYLNLMAATLFGAASADQMIGSPLMDRFHPSCHAMIRERLHLLYEENRALPIVEQTYIRLDGSPVPVDAHAVPIYNHQKASLTFARDISQRKEVEEALQESEKKFRTIFDKASDGILIADAITKKIIQGNTAMCSMLGYTKEEIESLTICDIHPSNDISLVLDEFEKLIKGEKVLAENLPVLRKDGSIFYADIGSAPTTIGGIHCLVGIFRDITERKQAEEQLLESLEQVRRAMQTTIQVLVMAVEIKDPYTAGHQHRMTNLARTMATEMGLTPEKIEGLRIGRGHPRYRQDHPAHRDFEQTHEAVCHRAFSDQRTCPVRL
jgi:PAS domain S-box-containing protein